jgi:hypothetical protein
MPIATFRGERTVAEIADKLFVRLTPRQREKAEATLLEANPQLRDIENMREGTILRVPDLPELRAKTNRDLENPDAQIVKNVSAALSVYVAELNERTKTAQEHIRTQGALLKDRVFKKEVSRSPELQALVESTAKATEVRTKVIAERQKQVVAGSDSIASWIRSPRLTVVIAFRQKSSAIACGCTFGSPLAVATSRNDGRARRHRDLRDDSGVV